MRDGYSPDPVVFLANILCEHFLSPGAESRWCRLLQANVLNTSHRGGSFYRSGVYLARATQA